VIGGIGGRNLEGMKRHGVGNGNSLGEPKRARRTTALPSQKNLKLGSINSFFYMWMHTCIRMVHVLSSISINGR